MAKSKAKAKAENKAKVKRKAKTSAPAKRAAPAKRPTRRWSQRVTQRSDALDLEEGVFTKRTARQVALSLKRSADRSGRRKSEPFRSALSMLTFHINRSGRGMTKERRQVLTQAKDELRRLYGRDD